MLTLAARAWLPVKALLSRALVPLQRRAPLPAFASPGELSAYMAKRLTYVADPLWGAIDYYTHPEAIQHQLERGTGPWACDCDDWAVYAYLALSRMPGVTPRLVTLVDSRLVLSHVVCAFRTDSGGFEVIDTNGLHLWVEPLTPEDEDRVLCELFGELYRCQYTAITTPYPF